MLVGVYVGVLVGVLVGVNVGVNGQPLSTPLVPNFGNLSVNFGFPFAAALQPPVSTNTPSMNNYLLGEFVQDQPDQRLAADRLDEEAVAGSSHAGQQALL